MRGHFIALPKLFLKLLNKETNENLCRPFTGGIWRQTLLQLLRLQRRHLLDYL